MMTCPGCGSKLSKDAVPLQRRSEFSLMGCARCDLQFWEPRNLEKSDYEAGLNGKFSIIMPGHIKVKTIYMWHDMFLKKFALKSGNLLDIGCGNGSFLNEAQMLGFKVYGIDFDSHSVETAAKTMGIKDVYAMNLKEFTDFAVKKGLLFDVITFFEVLEHQENAQEFIESVKKLLKPGGFIVGSVPNRNRLIIHQREEFDFPPHHFFWWSKNSLTNLFRSQGFKNIELSSAFRMKYLMAYLNSQIIGWGKNAKLSNKIKRSLFKVKNEESYANFESLIKAGRIGLMGKALLLVKSIVLFFPAFLLSRRLNPHIYFQCRL